MSFAACSSNKAPNIANMSLQELLTKSATIFTIVPCEVTAPKIVLTQEMLNTKLAPAVQEEKATVLMSKRVKQVRFSLPAASS